MDVTSLRRLLVVLVAGLVALGAWHRPMDDGAAQRINAGLQSALITYASARTLASVLSVFQGTAINAQPAGVGLTLTPGQALRPINDLLEQFSTVMLIASVAFGIEKVLLTVGSHWMISALVTGLAAIWAATQMRGRSPPWLSRVFVMVLLVRFAVPVVSLGTDLIFQEFLEPGLKQDQAVLDVTTSDIKAIKNPAPPSGEDKGWLDQIKDRAMAALPEVSGTYGSIKKSIEQLPERLITIIVSFLLQTILIPIVLLWGLYKILLLVIRPGRDAKGP